MRAEPPSLGHTCTVSEWVLLCPQTRAQSAVCRQAWESSMGKHDSGMERTTAISSSKTGSNWINLLLVSSVVVDGCLYFLFLLVNI